VDPAATAPQAESVPVPEAVIRALEARGELVTAPQMRDTSAVPLMRGATAPTPMRERTARTEPARHAAVRRVEIDVAKLRARGYVTPDSAQSQIADEYRVIKRPIIQNAVGRAGAPRVRNGNLVMITSALPAEGKTFTALNLAMSIAMEYDNTVLLVDGDVANPALPKLLGVPTSPGLLDLLTDSSLDIASALVKTNVDRLTVLPAGTPQRRATELLASEQMGILLGELASRYHDRIIIFDSPPLLATTEARVMASHMGQIVMVVAAESTSESTLNQALSTLESCEVVLMMLNKASRSELGSYGYYAANGTA
jgi:protein-tyrosine kinase